MSNSKGLAGLIIGAAIGAGITYLITSGKGKELLEKLKDEADKLKLEAEKLKQNAEIEIAKIKDELANND